MKYKIVGFVVWQGASWYLRRRYRGLGRKLAIGGGVALVAGGAAVAVAAQRRANDS
jgi:hypothetical protein